MLQDMVVAAARWCCKCCLPAAALLKGPLMAAKTAIHRGCDAIDRQWPPVFGLKLSLVFEAGWVMT
jgi:hypothetical protein